MLAQNFKSAQELGLTDDVYNALKRLLVMLETGKLEHYNFRERHYTQTFYTGRVKKMPSRFNMHLWRVETPCGTCCCLGGTLEAILKADHGAMERLANELRNDDYLPGLHNLFYDNVDADTTVEEAAAALRRYLGGDSFPWLG